MDMDWVLTFVAGGVELDDSTSRRVMAALHDDGAQVGDPRWLAAGRAFDLKFAGIKSSMAEASARAVLEDAPVDVIATPTSFRRKRLLVADMESTIIENEMVDEMADIAGLSAQIAEATAAAMDGKIDFAASLKQRAASFAGVSTEVLARALSRVRISPGAAALVGTMRRHGAHASLLSGGFSCFAAPVARSLGFDQVRANTLEIDAGVIAGRVREPILDRAGKATALTSLMAERGLAASDVVAVGDGANDLDMLGAAGLGVAYRAKPIVAAAAAARIIHADLRALLYVQGFSDREIVNPPPGPLFL